MVLDIAEKCPLVQKEIVDEKRKDLADGLTLFSPQTMVVMGAILVWHRTEIHHGPTLTEMTLMVVSVEAGVEGTEDQGADSILHLTVVKTVRIVIDGRFSSSSAEDNSVRADTRHRLRIKLQKFDETGSCKTCWAHFKNCASYNRWTERNKLAFMKGALTGNAAQVLWDTDRVTTGSWKKLVDMLKSRYSGKRQAEKYRAELQIRRRRHNESLSELHQDIRRLMALAYPKLTAEAREEIACDHFTNALSDCLLYTSPSPRD